MNFLRLEEDDDLDGGDDGGSSAAATEKNDDDDGPQERWEGPPPAVVEKNIITSDGSIRHGDANELMQNYLMGEYHEIYDYVTTFLA